MKIINYTDARKSLATIMDEVTEGHEVVSITRKNHEPVVMISLREYDSLTESNYLLKGKNQKRLLEAVKDIKHGKYAAKKLIADEK